MHGTSNQERLRCSRTTSLRTKAQHWFIHVQYKLTHGAFSGHTKLSLIFSLNLSLLAVLCLCIEAAKRCSYLNFFIFEKENKSLSDFFLLQFINPSKRSLFKHVLSYVYCIHPASHTSPRLYRSYRGVDT